MTKKQKNVTSRTSAKTEGMCVVFYKNEEKWRSRPSKDNQRHPIINKADRRKDAHRAEMESRKKENFFAKKAGKRLQIPQKCVPLQPQTRKNASPSVDKQRQK